MYNPTNSANYPASEQRIDCSQLVETLQENPKAIIAALDKSMSRIIPTVLSSGMQLSPEDANEYFHLKSLRDGLIKSVFNFKID